MEIALLASGHGVEVMRHRMQRNATWTILQETELGEFQYYLITRGHVHWRSERQMGTLSTGESLVWNVPNDAIELTATEDTEFLLFCSTPLFQTHVTGLRDLEELAMTIEQKDGYTGEHCARIQRISMQLGRALDLSPKSLFALNIGSFLHDVGKVRIPGEILNKAGALTEDEWKVMKLHPVWGTDMVKELKQYCLLEAAQIIELHHERYNGSGYPYGLKLDEIPMGAAIVAVADSFDAMTTDRIYRKAKPISEAVLELKQSRGVLFHPGVVDAFLSLGLDR